jgi:hypothetical protein
MLSVFRPSFEVVKEGRIFWDYLSFLLLFKVSGDRLSFAKPHFPVFLRNSTRSNQNKSGDLWQI